MENEKHMLIFENHLDWRPEEFISRYAYLLGSIIDERYEWYLAEITQSRLINNMTFSEKDLPNFLELLGQAC